MQTTSAQVNAASHIPPSPCTTGYLLGGGLSVYGARGRMSGGSLVWLDAQTPKQGLLASKLAEKLEDVERRNVSERSTTRLSSRPYKLHR